MTFVAPNDALLFAEDTIACSRRAHGLVAVRMPNGLSASQLKAIGRRGAEALLSRFGDAPICLVGVASRGLPIAVSVALSMPHPKVEFSLLKRVWRDDKIEDYRDTHKFVLVDNTIKSGLTLMQAAGQFLERSIEPALVLTFSHTVARQRALAGFKAKFHLGESDIVSLFPMSEIASLARSYEPEFG